MKPSISAVSSEQRLGFLPEAKSGEVNSPQKPQARLFDF